MITVRDTLVLLCVLFGILAGNSDSANAATQAGASIVNQATLSYEDANTGELVQILSNTSRIVVAQLKRFSLVSPHSVEKRAGAQVTFVHHLLNTGNVEDTYQLSADNLQGDNGDVYNLALYVDLNGNGLVDTVESIVDQSISLLPDESIDLIISGVVVETQPGDSLIEVSLNANSIDSAIEPRRIINTIDVLSEPDISLELVNNPGCEARVFEGERIEYSLSITNSSTTIPVDKQYLIDGSYKDGILISIALSDSLLLDKQSILDSLSFRATAMVKITDSTTDWMRLEHWNGESAIAEFGLLLPSHAFEKGEVSVIDFSAFVKTSTNNALIETSANIDNNGDGRFDSRSQTVCNTVSVPVAAVGTEIRFIEPVLSLQQNTQSPVFSRNEDFTDAPVYRLNNSNVSYELVRDGVYLELTSIVNDEQLIFDSQGNKYVLVNLASVSENRSVSDADTVSTRDSIQVLLRETNTDSQRYRSIRPVWLSPSLRSDGAFCPGDNFAVHPGIPNYEESLDVCVLNSASNDTLIVSFDDLSTSQIVSDTAAVDPTSRVFDAITLNPIEGATITVYNDSRVATNPLTNEPVVLVSDEMGRFSIPRLETSVSYHLDVTPPELYRFPTAISPLQFSSYSVQSASYGKPGFGNTGAGTFATRIDTAPPTIDIPLDPANSGTLLQITKSSDISTISMGDTVVYQLEVSNNSTAPMTNTMVLDNPPLGFRYLPGTSTLGEIKTVDPDRINQSSDSSVLSNQDASGLYFDFGSLDAGETKALAYTLQATPRSLNGDGVNTATASATTPSGIAISTSPARVKVSVSNDGVLSDKAIIFGKIYVDSTCDNMHNNSEWPIAGVRLYLQNGTYVTTDEDGQYSLYGLTPGLYVIKLDELTLPKGLNLKPLDVNHGADPSSKFIDLSSGDFHRADFATNCPASNPEVVFEQLRKRNLDLRGDWLLDEASRFNPDSASTNSASKNMDSGDGDISHGKLNSRLEGTTVSTPDESALTEEKTSPTVSENKQIKNDENNSNISQTMGDPKELVKTITQAQSKRGTWLWPATDLSNDGRFIAVIRSGLDPQLFVNDKPVSGSQIGERIINRREKAQLVAWYGIDLQPGENNVEVRGKDPFGNNRVLATGTFKKSGTAVRIFLKSKSDSLSADGGRSMLPIELILTDINGYPASGVYFVTLTTTNGSFLESDLQPKEPGYQIRVENGHSLIHLRSSETTGKLRIEAQTGTISTSREYVLLPASRPLIAAGLVELGASWENIDSDDSNQAALEEGFSTKVRSAFFMKGKIRNDLQLTMSLDTDKKNQDELLRDINPNEHYPVYGDSSTRGFEAQSRSKLYAKLERGRNSIMWGDYVTDNLASNNDLAKTQRTLTGFNSVFDNAKTRIQVFAAEQKDAREIEEIRGNGTAMLFKLSGAPLVINSEIIELIVKDRNNPGLVLSTRNLTRFSDYTIDHQTGNLRFSYTIPSIDDELNPVFLRITYDRESNLAEHLVAGLRWNQSLSENTSLGLNITHDENPLSGYTLAGLNLRTVLAHNTKLSIATATQIDGNSNQTSKASKVEIEHHWNGRQDGLTKVVWGKADTEFNNPGAGIASGRTEWRIEHRHQLGNTLKAMAEASHSESASDNTKTTNASLIFDKSYRNWTFTAGSRHVQSRNNFEDLDFTTVLLGVEKSFRFGNSRNGSIGIDYERALHDDKRFRFGINSKVQIHDHVNLYGRYEREQELLASSLLSSQDNNHSNTNLTIGLESDVIQDTQIYSEYRIRGGFTGDNIETASGIRGRYAIEPGLTVTPAFEYIDAYDSFGSNDSLALSVGLTDTRNPNRKFNSQAEVRDTKDSIYYGFRATLAQKLDLNWTGLVREELTRQTPDKDELTSRHRFTLGLARRPKLDNRHHTLFLANWNKDYGPVDGMDRTVYLFSTHHNRQINEHFSINGRVGGKWQTIHYDDGDLSTRVHLTDLRATFHWRRRWNFDFRGGWLATDSDRNAAADNRFSFGAGASWLIKQNLRVGIAYNFLGFREEDLDQQAFNSSGFQLGLQMKFDEDMFPWLQE